MNFKKFLIEKKNKEEKKIKDYNDIDCFSDNLTKEELEYCRKKRLIDFLKKAIIANN
jgi:hypothetical protein